MSLRTKLVLLTSGLGAALVAAAFLLVHFLFSDHVRRAAREDIAAIAHGNFLALLRRAWA